MHYEHQIKKLNDLTYYDKNSRVHTDEQLDQIIASINEFGFTNPILIDENNMIIAGHGRATAAQKMSLDEVPCILVEDLTDDQKKAYIIADNKLALNASWDLELLKMEVSELIEIDFDTGLFGFSENELKSLMLEREQGTNDPNKEWSGMPQFNQNDEQAFRSIVLHFKDSDGINNFAKLINQTITDKTRYIWFPFIEIGRAANKEYGDDNE